MNSKRACRWGPADGVSSANCLPKALCLACWRAHSRALALLFSWALLKFSLILAAEAFPAEWGTLIFDVTPNLAIFFFVLAISLAAGILFGLAPAMESSRAALSGAA